MGERVILTNGVKEKQCKIGFSWTVLFFQAFVPLLRGDWTWFFMMMILIPNGVVDENWRNLGFEFRLYYNSSTWSNFGLTLGGIFLLFFAFMYNRIYIRKLLKKGFAVNLEDQEILVQKEFIDSEGNLMPLFRKLNKNDLRTFLYIVGFAMVFICFMIAIHVINGEFNPHFEIIRHTTLNQPEW